MTHSRQEKIEALGRVIDVLERLRKDCPWDREQTNLSLRPNTIEEVYELTEAIIEKDIPNIKKELGDVLLHIVFYAKIASETKDFDITDVIHSLCDKLIHRHPHIYATTKANTAGDVERNWEQIKLKEKNGNKSVLSGVPSTLPALIKSYRIQDKARNVGFDWEKREQVWEKVKEEINEVQTEIESQNQDLLENEFGDLLFSIINVARHYNVDPETALERTNQKFIKRFNYLENKTIKQGKNLKEMTLAEMDEIWNEAKKI
jgi:XTP/dITP diphosphohydrolase